MSNEIRIKLNYSTFCKQLRLFCSKTVNIPSTFHNAEVLDIQKNLVDLLLREMRAFILKGESKLEGYANQQIKLFKGKNIASEQLNESTNGLDMWKQ
jgi:hypothetical protein